MYKTAQPPEGVPVGHDTSQHMILNHILSIQSAWTLYTPHL